MKRNAKKLLVLMLALLALSCTAAAEDGFTAEISVARGTAVIRSTELDGESWLFLPAFAAERKMELIRNGRSVEWQEIGSGRRLRLADRCGRNAPRDALRKSARPVPVQR